MKKRELDHYEKTNKVLSDHNAIFQIKLVSDDQNKKRGRPIKTLEDHVLEGKSADNFYREALKKKKKDMVGSGRNHSMRAPASKS